MKILILSGLLAILSPWTIADHHRQPSSPGHKLFERFDTDGDGRISSEEHERVLVEMSNQRRQRFTEMDTNGDGSVSEDEAKVINEGRREKWRQKMEKNRNEHFDKMDRDGDGMLSRDEAKAIEGTHYFKFRK